MTTKHGGPSQKLKCLTRPQFTITLLNDCAMKYVTADITI